MNSEGLRKQAKLVPVLAAALLLTTMFSGCMHAGETIHGAGATFANPIISLWSELYHDETGNQVSYNSIGSGGGIQQHTQKVVHFAASEAPLNPSQAAAAPGTLTFPFVIGTVTAAFNVQGVSELRLTGEVLADIFLGKITRWNDARITELNPGTTLPNQPITVVHRSDGSGTTFVWADYLSKMSEEWRERVGRGTSLQWPTGIGGNGNEGVAGAIQNSPYSIGYIELSYASQIGISTAAIRNQAGEFVKPSLEAGTTAAAGAIAGLPRSHEAWGDVSFTNAPGAGAYPVSSFSYFFIYEDLGTVATNKTTAQAIMDWLAWTFTEGQQYNHQVNNAAIPRPVQELNLEGLERVRWNGQALEIRYSL